MNKNTVTEYNLRLRFTLEQKCPTITMPAFFLRVSKKWFWAIPKKRTLYKEFKNTNPKQYNQYRKRKKNICMHKNTSGLPFEIFLDTIPPYMNHKLFTEAYSNNVWRTELIRTVSGSKFRAKECLYTFLVLCKQIISRKKCENQLWKSYNFS